MKRTEIHFPTLKPFAYLISEKILNNLALGLSLTIFGFVILLATNASNFTYTAANPLATSVIANISGTVYEDINYGGGNGRPYATADASAQASGWAAGDIGLNNVRVELYDATGAFVNATTTNTSGGYSFNGLSDGDYQIRVVNVTVVSNRPIIINQSTFAVQTFRSDESTNFINEVGGTNPSLVDTTANTGSANISSLTSATAVVQSVSSVTLAGSSSVANVDFGFNFDVIVNSNSDGQGSLRQFIFNSTELGNTNLDQEDNPAGGVNFDKPLGEEVSIFMIPGNTVHKILLGTVLPLIRDDFTHITGYTQLGAVQGTIPNRTIRIEVDGNVNPFDGMRVFASNTQISGLAIMGFGKGIYSYQANGTNNFFWGNYIGVEADGTTLNSNSGTGILLMDQLNSFVGTNADNNNDAFEGNLVTNSFYGVELRRCSGTHIAGNFVGTDKTGMLPGYGNEFMGIMLRDGTGANYVGFWDASPNNDPVIHRNLVSDNGTDGVRVFASDNQQVAGNFIGTNLTLTGKLSNMGYGVQFISSASDTYIGTNSNGDDDHLEGNVISGNNSGLRLVNTMTGSNNVIAGNFIGVDTTGNLPLGNLTHGIEVNSGPTNTRIGTDGDGNSDLEERNIIGDNPDNGIRLVNAIDVHIAGNHIGVGADGTTDLGNGKEGITLSANSSNNFIGYELGMVNKDELIVGNKIKYNDFAGINIPDDGVSNQISRNQISDNMTLGIELNNNLVTPNDNGDTDSGPNEQMNFPVINSATLLNGSLTINGFAPGGSTVEIFLADAGPSPSPLPAGYSESFGEGAIFLGSAIEGSSNDTDNTTGTYTDDGTGSTTTKTENRFQFTINVAAAGLVNLDRITSTATSVSNNTSEFSNVFSVQAIESCTNGIDDDGDGLVDCEDPDCTAYNSDGDDVCNQIDLDDDNDGIPDVSEGCSQTTDIAGTIGTNNVVNNSTFSIRGTSVTYTLSGANQDSIYGSTTSQGQFIYFNAKGASPANPKVGNLTTTFASPVADVTFKITDFDDSEVATINVYDENNVPYDLTTIGIISVGSNLSQSGNRFEEVVHTDVNGNNAADDPIGSVLLYFPGKVSVIAIDYEKIYSSSIRFFEPSYCSVDSDSDGVLDYLDLDSDNDGILDVDEAGHTASDTNVDGIIDGVSAAFGINGLFDGVETSPDSDNINYIIADSETSPDGNSDATELDADGDGCFDNFEAEANNDPDNDGIIGTGFPAPANPVNGLVNGHTYTHPPTTLWQNPAAQNCCQAAAPILIKN